MRCTLAILLIAVGVCTGNFEPRGGWKVNNEYRYLIESRTLATLNNDYQPSTDSIGGDKPLRYTGVLLRGRLALQPIDDEIIRGQITAPRYAQLHTELSRKNGDWNEVEIHDSMLNFKPLPMSGNNFEIKIKNGVVKDLIVDKNTPTWEVNVVKSIVSQLQVDTTGENAKRKDEDPEDEDQPFATFKVMEDSVGGKCEVMYDMAPLEEDSLQKHPELLPLPELAEQLKQKSSIDIEIVKTKNYGRCERRAGYHFGIEDETKWEPGANDNGRLLSKASTSRIVVTGSRKSFIIQSSVTTNKVFVSPRIRDDQLGLVQSRVNLTLSKVMQAQEKIEGPANPQTLESLVYTYNEPFGDKEAIRGGKNKLQDAPAFKQEFQSSSEGGSSSSASLGTASWESDVEYWQTKPSLSDPPETPLLPLFIGYKGKSVWNKINPIITTRDLVHQIAAELKTPNEIPDKQTLEKFNILGDVLRTMSHKQIMEAGAGYEEKDPKTKYSWVVFRDAVTQAGTGPALLAIKDWLLRGKLQEAEAAEVMGSLPNNVRNPTPEYIEELFSIATSSKVSEHREVSSSAILAFTELVRRAVVNEMSAHNRFPVHSFGRFVPRHDRTIADNYVPYLAAKLKESMEKGDSAKAQVYVVALGNLAHPAILAAYEPYLEGKIKTTKFMRLLMITSMSKLADIKPKLARSILYRVYTNTMESHEIRCAAVYLLMTTDPPLPMLQRMAEFTNFDTSRQVSSAVKSTIEAFAESVSPDLHKLAEKAKIARDWLTRKDFNVRYSHAYILDKNSEDEDDQKDEAGRHMAYRLVMSYIGSDHGFPNAWYFSMSKSHGGFHVPPKEITAMVSSVTKLLEISSRDKSKSQERTRTDDIAKMLGFVGDWQQQDEPLEGNILVSNQFLSKSYFFDEKILKNLQEDIEKEVEKLNDMQHYGSMKLVNHEVDISFPTETGLPFVLAVKNPTLFRTSVHADIKQEDRSINANLQLIHSQKIQTRAGFVTPFDHQEFITGVDTNAHFFLPGLELKLAGTSYRADGARAEIKLQPNSGFKNPPSKERILHYSTIPFTSRHDLLELTPVTLDKNTHVIREKEREFDINSDTPSDPMSIEYKGPNPLDKIESSNLMKMNLSPSVFLDNAYKQLDVYLNKPTMETAVTLKMSCAHKREDKNEVEKSRQTAPQTFEELSRAKHDSEARKKQMLDTVPSGIQAPIAHVVDFELEVSNKENSAITRQILSVAWASSGIDEKSRTLLYWRGEMGQSHNFEMCSIVQAVRQPTLDQRSMLMAAMMPTSSEQPIKEFTADIHYGQEACRNGGQIFINGRRSQSGELKKELERSVKKCQEVREKQRENENEPVSRIKQCEKVQRLAQAMNQLKLTVRFDEKSRNLAMITNMAVDSARNVWTSTYNGPLTKAYLDKPDDQDSEEGGDQERGDIDIKIKMDPAFEFADVNIVTFLSQPVTFHQIPLGPMANDDDEDEATCILEDTRAMTFDGKTYRPDKIEECSLVAMTTYSKDKSPIPKDKKVSVVKRTTKDHREMSVDLGSNTISLKANKNDKSIEVKVNEEKLAKLSPGEVYRNVNQKEENIEFEIYRFKDGSVGIVSEKYEIQAAFDGERMMIKASDEFRNSVRGLCGNFDNNPDNDFHTPNNCFLRSAKSFVPSFALTQENCQNEEVLGLAMKAQTHACHRLNTPPPNNMIKSPKTDNTDESNNDHKACNVHVTKYVNLNDEICFTTRPLPACVKGCQAKELRPKKYSLYCMSQGSQAAQDMKKRIDQGAKPDLSQKPSSKSWMFDVPMGCRPVGA